MKKAPAKASARKRTSTPEGKPKRAYHHGDLRRALLEAAWHLVSAQGLAGLTLREVARKVGVTHAAPYHHFATREALLEALAQEAFSALDAAMIVAPGDSKDPSERLFLLGRAYVDFARAHPEQLQVMFRRRSDDEAACATAVPHADPDSRAFAHLFEAVRACQEAGVAPAGDSHQLALTAWSIVHGFSKLWTEGPLDTMPPYAAHFAALRDNMLRSFVESWRELARARRRKR